MSEEELSRVYTINLSKVWLAPRIRRTKRAINMIREFAQRHMKSDDVKIDRNLNEVMWERGIRKPPRKIRVKMVKDEDDVVTVSLYSEEVKEEEKVEKKAKVEAVAEKAKEVEVLAPEPEKIVEEPEKEIKEEAKPKKKEKEAEPEKIELSEEELAEILTQEAEGIEVKEEKPEKRKGKKSKEESEEE
ncbi:MAG: 60S ribosomal protein L31 [Thaumarchaeota archaeon]|nr:60S ribosomal protein L31 [Nitrososphaerota archaeon]